MGGTRRGGVSGGRYLRIAVLKRGGDAGALVCELLESTAEVLDCVDDSLADVLLASHDGS